MTLYVGENPIIMLTSDDYQITGQFIYIFKAIQKHADVEFRPPPLPQKPSL